MEENELNYEEEKDGYKIKIEYSFRQMGELKKELTTQNIEYSKLEKRITKLKDSASNMDQMEVKYPQTSGRDGSLEKV